MICRGSRCLRIHTVGRLHRTRRGKTDEIQEKKCKKCGLLKPISDFHKHITGKYGVRSSCKDCRNAKKREIRAKDGSISRSKYRTLSRRWREENPELARQISQQWRRETERRKSKKRRSTPQGKLNRNMGVAICTSLRRGVKRGRRWESIVGYTVKQLKKHLEKKFQPGMSWENYGEWHIDHIIPISAFNYETTDDIDFNRAWALRNLQPLWAIENIKKHTRIEKPFQPSLLV